MNAAKHNFHPTQGAGQLVFQMVLDATIVVGMATGEHDAGMEGREADRAFLVVV